MTGVACAQAVFPALLVRPLRQVGAFTVLAAMGFLQPFRGTSQRALLAELVADDDRVRACGAHRVANNIGAALGPVMAAVLVALDWSALHAGIAVVYALSILPAVRLPDPPATAHAGTPPSLRLLARDRAFLLVFGAGLLGWMTYQSFEVLLPVSLTQGHAISPSTWGLVYPLNAVAVVLLQMRITRWTARFGAARNLAAAMLLMGLPFLLLEASGALPVVIVIVLVFVLGEMLWAPQSEALVAGLAPPGMRGVYLGTVGAATWMGAALMPAVGLNVRGAAGDGGMWLFVAAVSVFAAAAYALATGARGNVVESEPWPRSTGSTALRTSTR